jgi:L-asparaginase II
MERQNPFSPHSELALPACGDTPLEVCLVRGNGVESRHRVQVFAMRDDGKDELRWGNPDFRFYPRSTLKMLQAIPWLKLPEAKNFLRDSRNIAIACGSHHGESFHVELVNAWLKTIGAEEKDLECGTHDPANKSAFVDMIRRGEKSCQIHNNCSGKHCGFLTFCKIREWEFEGYSNFDHPLQVEIRRFLSDFLKIDLNQRSWGIDGCGIPTYYLSLQELAFGMKSLANPKGFDSEIEKTIHQMNSAITEFPDYLGGTLDFSSRIVAETKGSVFAKVGAEGVYGLWMPSEGLGISLKSEDGNPRACEAAIVRILAELGYSIHFHSTQVKRWSGEVVGEMICG